MYTKKDIENLKNKLDKAKANEQSIVDKYSTNFKE